MFFKDQTNIVLPIVAMQIGCALLNETFHIDSTFSPTSDVEFKSGRLD
jgi:hypothetical protein